MTFWQMVKSTRSPHPQSATQSHKRRMSIHLHSSLGHHPSNRAHTCHSHTKTNTPIGEEPTFQLYVFFSSHHIGHLNVDVHTSDRRNHIYKAVLVHERPRRLFGGKLR